MSAETAPAAIAYDIKTAIGGVVDRINNRVSGKSWKLAKAPTKRAQMPRTLRKSWDQRLDERKKLEMVKTLQKEMKDEKKADKDVRFVLCSFMPYFAVYFDRGALMLDRFPYNTIFY
ncbi:hypothetical protein BC936DRAFT_146675 [Jimgerdemannia flammicorona]|uniref:rRNA-processing protein n=1 Tax=Jimgerdemannia flammicorona TaxID=994334 RepID=A0A433D744_9FUNG|nr:hypothetical protein BC936DRAFT_146675 [Jimgerdemannia flammicorona]